MRLACDRLCYLCNACMLNCKGVRPTIHNMWRQFTAAWQVMCLSMCMCISVNKTTLDVGLDDVTLTRVLMPIKLDSICRSLHNAQPEDNSTEQVLDGELKGCHHEGSCRTTSSQSAWQEVSLLHFEIYNRHARLHMHASPVQYKHCIAWRVVNRADTPCCLQRNTSCHCRRQGKTVHTWEGAFAKYTMALSN